MKKRFQVGDHVTWNSEAGRVSGKIVRVHMQDTEYKGHPRHASRAEPQYEIKSDKTDHVAMHKGSALTLARSRSRSFAVLRAIAGNARRQRQAGLETTLKLPIKQVRRG